MTSTLAEPLIVAEPQLDFETWKKKGERLIRDFRANEETLEKNQWEIGDWILAGFKTFGKQKAYDEAEQITGFDRNYLQTVVWVVKQFPDSSLRKESLKWSHFKELAYIEDEQARKRVLAEFNDGFPYSVRDIRERVQQELNKPKQGGSSKPSKIGSFVYIRVPFKPDFRKQIKDLATAEGKAPDELVHDIIVEYFEKKQNWIVATINKAKRRFRKR